jgi:hypothetical protein
MASSQSYQYATYISSSSTTENGVQRTGRAYQETSHVDPSGARVQTTSQNLGELAVQETRYYDAEGNQVLSGGKKLRGGQTPQGRIEAVEDVDDEEAGK